ncbi:MAG: alpha-galactosidase, partial [Anaerolineae bacterium]
MSQNALPSITSTILETARGERLLTGTTVDIPLPQQPRRFYIHGWQSWSLSAWVDVERPLHPPRPPRLHPMQTDPLYATDPSHHGSWLGAVEFADERVLLLGALGTDAHVRLDGNTLRGHYENGSGEWLLAWGEETQVFARYAELLGERLERSKQGNAPRVWCSWYSYYTHIDEKRLRRTLDDLGDLPFEVFQVDDGWQRAIGDWEPNEKFPSGMADLAKRIRETGRTPGLWLAPLLATPTSSLCRDHPDWLLRDESGKPVSAGFNWGQDLFALDTTHPDVAQWLCETMRRVREWGYAYIKLDFLYAGALPGRRHDNMPREAAYRQALQALREALGKDAYLLACGAPIIPSLGLCDALRVGPDVASYWDNPRDDQLLHNFAIPGTRNAIRTTIHRLWLRPLVRVDPDVVYFRSRDITLTESQKRRLQDLALICGYKATSDPPAWLDNNERAALRAFLEAQPTIERLGRYTFRINGREVDFSAA